MKYISKKDLILLIIQVLGFYLLPYLMSHVLKGDPFTLVLINIWLTFLISLVISYSSTNKYRFLYPVVVALLFLPTVAIYYNSTALIHAVWYLVIGYIGVGIGLLLNLLKQN